MSETSWLRRIQDRLTGNGLDRRADWPSWYREYADSFQSPPPPGTPLHELPVVVLDAETTGLDVRRDRILSLGALRVSGNSISLADKFEAYLPVPDGFDGSESVSIHGIIPNSSRYDHTDEPTLLAEFLTYLGSKVIVGHHIGFDVEMINRSLLRHGAPPLRNAVVDTADLAKRLRPAGYWTPRHDYGLDALAKRYTIPLSDRHTALGDCYITAVLWLKLLRRLAVKLDRDLVLGDVLKR
ncbi:DNA polymerase III epsilon subunit [Neolewinella xylanilytica]|uniref:DNA polymerase III epsilon subunit n=1 Tax=Neolewinella xylanilytica TaxID=1514080 RepID=A0A2S6I6F4_9BACT|nr:3'-5' exonuclease [Neolewinella xylanilytica]PPK86729.1 DNA polymerase III epsilon subunit [Neolewinella xylanilytica]